MRRITKNLYVGDKSEYRNAVDHGAAIVCAMNNGGSNSYQSMVGKKTPDHPDYLYKDMGNEIYLNMIDGKDPKYVHDDMIDAAVRFIDRKIKDHNVFIYCSKGESRAPSLAMIYMMDKGLIAKDRTGIMEFHRLYPEYLPGEGIKKYITHRYGLK